jgi:ZIP family zinc transporter
MRADAGTATTVPPAPPAERRGRALARAAVPLAGLAVLVALLVSFDPIGSITDAPPVEELAVERAVLREGLVELHVRNDGPDPVTIAQVIVNDAYWQHEVSDRTLSRLDRATVSVPYPWEEGLPVNVRLVSSSGATFDHEIEVAAETPEPGGRSFGIYTLLGLAIGVVPVALGLLWLPSLRRASARWLAAALAFTVGLLAFLLVDTVDEGLELAGATPEALGGLELFAVGALVVVVALLAVEEATRRKSSTGTASGLALAYLVALGIGLHNLGEGLAVGAASARGAVALGTALVVGFAVHNLTEGLAIASPLSERARVPARHLVGLVAVAGLPTVPGAWLGAFAFSPAWAALAFGVAAGAIAQVLWVVGRHLVAVPEGRSGTAAAGFVAALVVMYATGLAVA